MWVVLLESTVYENKPRKQSEIENYSYFSDFRVELWCQPMCSVPRSLNKDFLRTGTQWVFVRACLLNLVFRPPFRARVVSTCVRVHSHLERTFSGILQELSLLRSHDAPYLVITMSCMTAVPWYLSGDTAREFRLALYQETYVYICQAALCLLPKHSVSKLLKTQAKYVAINLT